MAANGHETVSFKGACECGGEFGFAGKYLSRVFGSSFHRTLLVILVQEMNGVPFREEDGLVSVLALSLGLAWIRTSTLFFYFKTIYIK